MISFADLLRCLSRRQVRHSVQDDSAPALHAVRDLGEQVRGGVAKSSAPATASTGTAISPESGANVESRQRLAHRDVRLRVSGVRKESSRPSWRPAARARGTRREPPLRLTD